MDAATLSGYVTVAILLVAVIYDLYAYLYFGTDGTISAWIRRSNQRWPLFGVLLGVLIGGLLVHWFGLY